MTPSPTSTARTRCAFTFWRQARRVAGLAPVLLLSACLSSPAVQDYSLRDTSWNASATPTPAPQLHSVGIGPVSVPELLDRSEWVVSIDDSPQMRILSQQRWAQPLQADIAQALAQQLSQSLGPVVHAHRADWPGRTQLQVQLDVLAFDTRLPARGPGAVRDELRWHIRCGLPAAVEPRHGQARFAQAAAHSGPAAVAQAHAQVLAQVGAALLPDLLDLARLCPRP